MNTSKAFYISRGWLVRKFWWALAFYSGLLWACVNVTEQIVSIYHYTIIGKTNRESTSFLMLMQKHLKNGIFRHHLLHMNCNQHKAHQCQHLPSHWNARRLNCRLPWLFRQAAFRMKFKLISLFEQILHKYSWINTIHEGTDSHLEAKSELQASFPTGRIQPWMNHQSVLATPRQVFLGTIAACSQATGGKHLTPIVKSYLESGWREVCMTLGAGNTPARPIETARNE